MTKDLPGGAMRGNEKTLGAFVDPQYSVLGLSPGLSRHGAQYLDVVTGWLGWDRTSRGVVRRRSVQTEGLLLRTGVR